MPHSKRQLEERQMRKERILSGALQVFKKNGIDGATMDEIANESGFGKATLYYYFKSKEDAIHYAKSNNIDYEVLETSGRKVISKSYADNFK